MTKQASTAPAARGGVTVICFLLIIVGQVYLLRAIPANNSFDLLSLPFILEFVFCLFMLIGCAICFIRPKGWTSTTGCITVLILFALYMVANIIYYPIFSVAYLTGFNPQYSSSAGALVGFKLVLALIGVTAGIPVVAPIDKREYSRRLREKVEQQDAIWAKTSVIGAKKELELTLAKLKGKLNEEELSDILNQLQSENSVTNKEDVAEQWRGWGGGM